MSDRGVSKGRLIDDPLIAGLLSEISDFAVFEIDKDGVCTGWEPISDNYQSTPMSEFIGHTLDKFYTAEDRETNRYWNDLAEAKRLGRAEGNGWRTRWDGSRSYMRFIVLSRTGEAGEHIGYIGIAYDATRQRLSESALYESEEALRVLVDGLSDHALVMLDRHGVVTNWNSGAERLLGYADEEAIGQHVSIFYTEEDRAEEHPQKALIAAKADGRLEIENWRVRKDGSRFRARVLVQPVHDEDGAFIGFAKLIRDISTEHDVVEQLAATHDALEQSERLRSLGELTGGIAHDFNNLLTVVRGSAELLKRGELPDEKRRHHLDAIIETADRAAELTGQLLSFARRQPLRPKLIDLNTVIVEMAALLKRTLGEGISILNTPESGLWQVRADPTQLRNLVLNAALNARDAMNGSGTLTITTRNISGPQGDDVRLSISDTGTGMAAEVKARAFEPFFTTKAPGEGPGLGLSQAYGFAAQSGGRLDLASEPGRGTTLSLFLPRAGDATAAAERGAGAEEESVPAGTRILLVEDSRTVAVFAKSLLEDMGCEIVHAANADEAKLALETDPDGFDIIFSDIVMPGTSGLDLAAEIRSQRPTLPILLATGYSEAAARGEGSEFPILPKPYRRETLSSMLGRTISALREAA